jgi:hypothetical protein
VARASHLAAALALAAAGLLESASAAACSRIAQHFGGVPADEYVFYGKVIGYSTYDLGPCTSSSDGACGTSWGLQLQVLDGLQMPMPGVRELDLFDFGVNSLCNALAVSESTARAVPKGARLMVAARALEGHRQTSGTIALDGSFDAVVLNVPRGASIRELRERRYRYTWSWNGGAGAARFEVRKDLLRLAHAPTKSEGSEIVRRLADYAVLTPTRGDPPGVGVLLDSLIARWIDARRPSAREPMKSFVQ